MGKPPEHDADATDSLPGDPELVLEAIDLELYRLGRSIDHDLRAPVRRTRGLAEMLEQQGHDDPIIARMIANANRAEALIDGMVDYAKLIVSPLRRVELSWATLIAEAWTEATARCPTVNAELDVDELPTAQGDPSLVKRLLEELFTNALVHCQRDAVTVSLIAKGSVLQLSDDGAGLPAGPAERLLRPFVQGPKATTGAGMGLAMAKRITEHHGGTIAVESDGGSRVSFSLCAGVTIDAAQPREHVEDDERGRPLQILISEDDLVLQRVMSTHLQRRGHHVTLVDNGKRAIEEWRAGDFDILLLDVQTPEVNGIDVARNVRGQPGGADQLIAAVTAYGAVERLEGWDEACFDRLLTKPFTGVQLCGAVERWVTDQLAMKGGIFDRHAALGICGGDEALLCELSDIYRSDLGPSLTSLKEAFDEADWPRCARAAHKLRGMAKSLASQPMAQAARDLEKSALRGKPLSTSEIERVERLANSLAEALPREPSMRGA